MTKSVITLNSNISNLKIKNLATIFYINKNILYLNITYTYILFAYYYYDSSIQLSLGDSSFGNITNLKNEIHFFKCYFIFCFENNNDRLKK